MSRSSKDNSLTRYEEILRISVLYHQYLPRAGQLIVFSSVTRKEKAAAANFIKNIKFTLKKMDKKNREFAKREFFSSYQPDWWTKYYSRSTYYRKRYNAIKSFLENYQPC